MCENIPNGLGIGTKAFDESLLLRMNCILLNAHYHNHWSTRLKRITFEWRPNLSHFSTNETKFAAFDEVGKQIMEGRKSEFSKSPYSQCYPQFHEGLDCILSWLGLLRSPSSNHARSVSERLPYLAIADLGSNLADCPILNIATTGHGY